MWIVALRNVSDVAHHVSSACYTVAVILAAAKPYQVN